MVGHWRPLSLQGMREAADAALTGPLSVLDEGESAQHVLSGVDVHAGHVDEWHIRSSPARVGTQEAGGPVVGVGYVHGLPAGVALEGRF